MLINCAVTAQLICAFVFGYGKSRFSHDEAQKISDFSWGQEWRTFDKTDWYRAFLLLSFIRQESRKSSLQKFWLKKIRWRAKKYYDGEVNHCSAVSLKNTGLIKKV